MEQKERKKIHNKWFWADQVTRSWEIWACVSSQRKKDEVYLCFEDYWKETFKGGRNYRTVYPGA